MRIPLITNWFERRKMREAALTALVHSDTQLHEKQNYVVVKIDEHSDALTDLVTNVDELLKLNRRRELLVAAAMNLVEKLDDEELAHDTANAFSVTELFPLVDLLRTAGYDEAANWWADAHDGWADFMSDEDEPDEHQDQDQPEPAEGEEPANPLIATL
jgi:hypothetical protein